MSWVSAVVVREMVRSRWTPLGNEGLAESLGAGSERKRGAPITPNVWARATERVQLSAAEAGTAGRRGVEEEMGICFRCVRF